MRYKTLLFDVDDTLLDFQAAEKQALHALHEAATADPIHWGFDNKNVSQEDIRDWMASLTDRVVMSWFWAQKPSVPTNTSYSEASP